MKRFFRQVKNLIIYKFYSFELIDYSKKQRILKPGDILRIQGIVKNNGFRLGTTYVIIKLSDPYNHKTLIFNTDKDFDETTKQTLRLVDIPVYKTREFCCDIPISSDVNWGVIDIKIELWTPAKLFKRSTTIHYPYPFYETKWRGFVEIVKPLKMINKVFISYSWQSKDHQDWVKELSEELSKYKIEIILDQKDLFAGEETTLFMEDGTTKLPICIAVCSSTYVRKANKRERGVGYEISLLTNDILEGRKRFTIIPIIRDNPEKKRPKCFGSQLYIDMDTNEWKAEPLLTLVNAIKHATVKLNAQ